jgi:hypothetical protein
MPIEAVQHQVLAVRFVQLKASLIKACIMVEAEPWRKCPATDIESQGIDVNNSRTLAQGT